MYLYVREARIYYCCSTVINVRMLSHVLTQSARCVGSEFRDARGALCEEHHVLSTVQRASAAQ